MSPKSLRFTVRQIIKIIEAKGFSLSRQSGSHMIFHNEKGDFDYQHYMLNNGTPKEIMIMQLRHIIKELEREYFNQFRDKPFS